MQGKFEENINQQLSNFSLEPSPQIWLDVETALHPHQKHRGIIWWWMPLLGLLLAGGGWWFYHSTNETKNNIHSSISQNKNAINDNLIDNEKKQVENIPSNIQSQKNKIKKEAKENINSSLTIQSIKIIDRKNTIPKPENNVAVEDQQNKKTTTIIKNGENISDKNKEKYANNITVIVQKNIDSIISTNEKHTTTKDKNDSAIISLISKNKIQIPNKNKTNHWLIAFGIGGLQVNRLNSFSVNQLAYSSATVPANIYPLATEAKNGVNFFAGIVYEKNINKRWCFNTGLQYRYLQNKQSVGLDSTVTGGIIYYTAVNTTTKTNYAHWLQVPVVLSYSINPSAKNKFQLILGGSFAWAFAEKWLVTDPNNFAHPYFYNASINNHVFVNLSAGIGYNYNDKFRILLLAEQSLSPIHKQSTNKFYWQQLSLQISKPIQFSSRKNKKTKP